MDTEKEKPRGYFEKLLAIDCETTGINFSSNDPSEGHQALSWGLIVADAKTLKPIEELYLEIKYNELSKKRRKEEKDFGVNAANIHGLTFDYLEKHGIDEQEAVVKIANLIIKYWGPTVQVKTLGHNVHMFDVPFLRSLFKRYNIDVPIGSRHYDSNSVGFITVGAYESNALFETMGFKPRNNHNALEDARMSLETCRKIKELWEKNIGIKAYDRINDA